MNNQLTKTETAVSIQPACSSGLSALPGVLATKLGIRRDLVSAVVAAVSDGDTIRAVLAREPLVASAGLTAELQMCAKQYTGCANTDEMTFDECVEFVVSQFYFLNVSELRQAFRLAAAGELGDVSLAAYHGLFTVAMLGQVLTAYLGYRKRVADEVLRAEKEAEFAEVVVLRSQRHDLVGWGERRKASLLAIEGLDERHCTVYDYEHFTGSGELQVTEEEKRAAWADAYAVAVGYVQDDFARGLHSAKFILEKIANKQHDEGFTNKRVGIAKRLLVKRWIESLKQIESVHQ